MYIRWQIEPPPPHSGSQWLYAGRAAGTIDAESALLIYAALWEAACNGGFDEALEEEMAK